MGTAWTVNTKGEVWTLTEQGGGDLYSPANVDFALDIGVGADGTAWIISTQANVGQAGNHVMYLSDPAAKSWASVPGPAAATRVAGGPDGVAWTVNDRGEVWTLMPQGGGDLYSPSGEDFALDIGVGADGTAWIISTQANVGQAGNHVMYLSDPAAKSWATVPGPAAAMQVAGGPDGVAWTVNDRGEVWTLHQQGGGNLYTPAGADFAMDVGVSPDGTVWIISSQANVGQAGNHVMYLSDPAAKSWTTLPGPAAASVVSGG